MPGDAFRHAHAPSWYSPSWQNRIECYKKLLQKQPAANAGGSKNTEEDVCYGMQNHRAPQWRPWALPRDPKSAPWGLYPSRVPILKAMSQTSAEVTVITSTQEMLGDGKRKQHETSRLRKRRALAELTIPLPIPFPRDLMRSMFSSGFAAPLEIALRIHHTGPHSPCAHSEAVRFKKKTLHTWLNLWTGHRQLFCFNFFHFSTSCICWHSSSCSVLKCFPSVPPGERKRWLAHYIERDILQTSE